MASSELSSVELASEDLLKSSFIVGAVVLLTALSRTDSAAISKSHRAVRGGLERKQTWSSLDYRVG